MLIGLTAQIKKTTNGCFHNRFIYTYLLIKKASRLTCLACFMCQMNANYKMVGTEIVIKPPAPRLFYTFPRRDEACWK
jgi:hypothetical protein